MTDSEVFQFNDVFKALERVFPKRLQEHELQRMMGDYFRLMRKFSVQQVQAGSEVWMQRGKYFPKPAEWIDAIPRRSEGAADVPALSEYQAAEYIKAEKARWEGASCSCHDCRRAGITEKPLRFVPEVNENGTDRKVKCGERIVTAGHWAHGLELARWYQAKGDFYEAYYAALQQKGWPKQGRRPMPALPEAS